jgi:threonine dehydrogenase-like Zn-dependent dehydrogenase
VFHVLHLSSRVLNSQVVAGDDCLVLGCGTIGLFAVQVAKAIGASKIIACDIDDAKLELGTFLLARVLL